MKVVIAIDSFKGSLDSIEAGEAAAEGVKRVYPDAETVVYPLADGGEGTVQALAKGLGGKLEHIKVTGPLGEKVVCEYAIVEKTRVDAGKEEDNADKVCRKTAIIEMAGAAGITLVLPKFRNPMHTTTYGVGEVIKDAIAKGCRDFIIGIGGSATNDGGIGMLQALGGEFLDKSGKQVPFGACGVEKLASINCENMLPELKECNFRIACDVDNPLCGKNGCSHIFGPQKGATPEMVEQMDEWMERYVELTGLYINEVPGNLQVENKADISEKYNDHSENYMNNCALNSPSDGEGNQFYGCNPNYPGSGAAGGLGFAFRTFLHGNLEPGINIVLDEVGIESQLKTADIIITGEGRLDGQTVRGKAPIGVARLAQKYGKPVLAFSGAVTEDASVCNQCGITAFFPILRQVTTLEAAMHPATAQRNMRDTVEQVFRLLKIKSI